MTSFRRQLAVYGFSRITYGPDRGGYYHENFLRGRRLLCCQGIPRILNKPSNAAPLPFEKPDFYSFSPCHDGDPIGLPCQDHQSMLPTPPQGLAANATEIPWQSFPDLRESSLPCDTNPVYQVHRPPTIEHVNVSSVQFMSLAGLLEPRPIGPLMEVGTPDPILTADTTDSILRAMLE